MATFDAYPALDIKPMASPLDLAGKAAELNGQLLTNTGMGLDQHYTRLGAMFRAGMGVLNPDGTADPQTVKNLITDQVKLGNISATEGATLLTSVPGDSKSAGSWLRSNLAGVGNNLAAITPMLGLQDTGSGLAPFQSNAFAAGGATGAIVQNTQKGMDPNAAGALVTVTNPDGSSTRSTAGQASSAVGGHPNATSLPTFDSPPASGETPAQGVPAPLPIAQTTLPPAGPQVAADAMTAIGNPNMLTTPATPGNQLAGTGAPITIPAAADAIHKQNTDFYTADIAAGNDPSLAASVGNLQGIVAASATANTGAASGWIQNIARVLNLGDMGNASDLEIMNKESGMLSQQLGAMGQQTDAGAAQQLLITPNGQMTPGAIKATAALTMGLLQYKINMAKASQDWASQNGQNSIAPNYGEFRQQYIDTAPSPLILALPMMPRAQQEGIIKYIKTLPDDQKNKLWAQLNSAGKK